MKWFRPWQNKETDFLETCFQKHLQRVHVHVFLVFPSFAIQQALFPEAKYVSALLLPGDYAGDGNHTFPVHKRAHNLIARIVISE